MASLIRPSKLDMLAEQTAFLLEKQKEMKAYYQKEYAEFLRVLDSALDHVQKQGEQQEVEDLQFIRHVIDEQGQQLSKDVQEDINFLTSQLNGISQVRALNDVKKEQEFEQLLLEEAQDILPTTEFKQEVMTEVNASRQSLSSMFQDFKNALEEGGSHTLALLLEAMAEEAGQDDEFEGAAGGEIEISGSAQGDFDDDFDEDLDDEDEDPFCCGQKKLNKGVCCGKKSGPKAQKDECCMDDSKGACGSGKKSSDECCKDDYNEMPKGRNKKR